MSKEKPFCKKADRGVGDGSFMTQFPWLQGESIDICQKGKEVGVSLKVRVFQVG